MRLRRTGDQHQATSLFLRCLSVHPGDSQASLMAASCLAAVGADGAAVERLRVALRGDPLGIAQLVAGDDALCRLLRRSRPARLAVRAAATRGSGGLPSPAVQAGWGDDKVSPAAAILAARAAAASQAMPTRSHPSSSGKWGGTGQAGPTNLGEALVPPSLPGPATSSAAALPAGAAGEKAASPSGLHAPDLAQPAGWALQSASTSSAPGAGLVRPSSSSASPLSASSASPSSPAASCEDVSHPSSDASGQRFVSAARATDDAGQETGLASRSQLLGAPLLGAVDGRPRGAAASPTGPQSPVMGGRRGGDGSGFTPTPSSEQFLRRNSSSGEAAGAEAGRSGCFDTDHGGDGAASDSDVAQLLSERNPDGDGDGDGDGDTEESSRAGRASVTCVQGWPVAFPPPAGVATASPIQIVARGSSSGSRSGSVGSSEASGTPSGGGVAAAPASRACAPSGRASSLSADPPSGTQRQHLQQRPGPGRPSGSAEHGTPRPGSGGQGAPRAGVNTGDRQRRKVAAFPVRPVATRARVASVSALAAAASAGLPSSSATSAERSSVAGSDPLQTRPSPARGGSGRSASTFDGPGTFPRGPSGDQPAASASCQPRLPPKGSPGRRLRALSESVFASMGSSRCAGDSGAPAFPSGPVGGQGFAACDLGHRSVRLLTGHRASGEQQPGAAPASTGPHAAHGLQVAPSPGLATLGAALDNAPHESSGAAGGRAPKRPRADFASSEPKPASETHGGEHKAWSGSPAGAGGGSAAEALSTPAKRTRRAVEASPVRDQLTGCWQSHDGEFASPGGLQRGLGSPHCGSLPAGAAVPPLQADQSQTAGPALGIRTAGGRARMQRRRALSAGALLNAPVRLRFDAAEASTSDSSSSVEGGQSGRPAVTGQRETCDASDRASPTGNDPTVVALRAELEAQRRTSEALLQQLHAQVGVNLQLQMSMQLQAQVAMAVQAQAQAQAQAIAEAQARAEAQALAQAAACLPEAASSSSSWSSSSSAAAAVASTAAATVATSSSPSSLAVPVTGVAAAGSAPQHSSPGGEAHSARPFLSPLDSLVMAVEAISSQQGARASV